MRTFLTQYAFSQLSVEQLQKIAFNTTFNTAFEREWARLLILSKTGSPADREKYARQAGHHIAGHAYQIQVGE